MKALFIAVLLGFGLRAQDFQQRGVFDARLFVFPQTTPGDSGKAVGDGLFRYEASRKITSWLRVYGAIDARTDSHRQTEREFRFDWNDRGLLRPALSLRRLSAMAHKGPITFEFGKQSIRWGKADVFNPMDRFAPKDFINVVDSEFMGVPAARLSIEKGSDTIDLIWQIRFTPSRVPLLNQRWAVLPDGFAFRNGRTDYPGGAAVGIRWNHVGKGYEYSLAFYDGHNHLPLFSVGVTPELKINLNKYYPQMKMYGVTAAVPTRWFTIKGESAYFTSSTKTADEYFQYVVQLERQSGEWSFVGGYAGEVVTERRNPLGFSPDRGLAKTFLGRASLTIDPYRSMAFEGAVRQNGDGSWLKSEYTQTLNAHWKAVAAFSWIRGSAGDFLGQYRKNSHAVMGVRYSF